jgi:A/G-specific adenine glycosylase
MAQQTRLETVQGYFVRWMERFPTVEALAQASQHDVLKQWEGLGYYARARNLHRAAQVVVEEYAGKVPDRREELLRLPGIGAYTAGAILSMAYGRHEPVLDGNAKRVFSRIADISESVDDHQVVVSLWQMAASLVDGAEPGMAGVVNEAIMELGALICTPASPRCLVCPLADLCRSAENGTQHCRPVRSRRKATPHYDVTAGIIWQGEPHGSALLIAQRPQDGMLGGLWEFPGGKAEASDPDLPACLRREIREELGVKVEVMELLTTVAHAYTHFRITLHAYHARHLSGTPKAIGCDDWRWVQVRDLDEFPFPVTDQKIIQALRHQSGNARSLS